MRETGFVVLMILAAVFMINKFDHRLVTKACSMHMRGCHAL
jgi:hypothetical protein